MNPFSSSKNQPVGKIALTTIGVVIIGLSIGISFFFSRESERFFWEVRTKSITQEVTEASNRLLDANDIKRWDEASSTIRIQRFAQEIKHEIPSIVAIRIFTTNALMVWSDLKDKTVGTFDEDLILLKKELVTEKIAIEKAGTTTKKEVGVPDLLEIYTPITKETGEIIGYIEGYFDSSDIKTFIIQTQLAIVISVTTAIIIMIFLLSLSFRQQDQIIRRQAYELASLVNQSPIGIYTINSQGKIISINPKMLALLEEVDKKNILKRKVWDIKNISNMNINNLIQGALGGVAFSKEVPGTLENGSHVYYHYHGTPIMSENGKTIEQVMFLVEDITEHKKLEKKFEEYTKDLEEGVRKRTKELQDKINELEQFQRLTVGREIKMTELKNELEKMREKIARLNKHADQK